MLKQTIIIYFAILSILFLSKMSRAQTVHQLSLTDAYEILNERYPSLRNGDLLEQVYGRQLKKLDLELLPSLNWKAEGRLQSDSPHMDVPEGQVLPFEINLPLYAFKTYGEAQYTVLDGGINDARRALEDIRLKVDQQALEVEKFDLRKRVNQLFLTTYILRAQREIFQFSFRDLQTRKDQIMARIENGTALQSDLKEVEISELELQSREENIDFGIKASIQSLSQLLNLELAADVDLILPVLSSPATLPTIERPEYDLFRLRRELILANAEIIDASLRPQLSTFFQAGLGVPNSLNFLDKKVAPFAIAGFSFRWIITDWHKNEIDKEILALESQKLQNMEETFTFNIESQESRYLAELDRLNTLMAYDDKISRLHADLLTQMAVQLDEGVITASDYIIQLNKELRSRQNKLIRQAELIILQLEFWNERGSF